MNTPTIKSLLLGLLTTTLGFAQPQPLNVIPTNGQTGVPRNARILVRFGYFNNATDSIRLSQAGRPIDGRQEQREGWNVFTPSAPLAPRTTYDLSVAIPNNPPYSGRFTTGDDLDNTTPTILSERSGERRDGSGPNLEIRFSKPMNPISVLASTLLGAFPISASVTPRAEISLDATTLTVFSDSNSFSQIYAINFRDNPAAFDWTGNRLPALPSDLLISTYPSAPRAAPVLLQSIPSPGETSVPTNNAILLEFSANLAGDEISLARSIDFRDQDGQPVPFRLDRSNFSLPQRYILIRPSQLLRGNRGYRLQVSGLRDEFSNTQSTPVSLDFQTAPIPELQTFRVLTQPAPNSQAPLPSNLQVRWTFSRPVGLVLAAANGQGTNQQGTNELARALQIQLSADRLSLVAIAPAGGTYSGQLQVFDRVELRSQSLNYNLNISAPPDNSPPALLYTLPAEASSFPANGRLRAVFSEAVVLLEAPTLLRDGTPLPLDVTTSIGTTGGTSVEITPRARLEVGAQYLLRVPAVQDLSGNPLPAREILFQASAALSGAPVLVSTTPSPLANDVDRNQPLVFEFDRPIDPASIEAIRLTYGPATFASSGLPADRWTFRGNSATFMPDPRWPRSSIVNWQLGAVRDWAGNSASSFIFSRFATRDDEFEAIPLRIISTSLPDGAVLPAGGGLDNEILFRVSTPVNPATLNSATVQVLEGDQPTPYLRSIQYDASARAIRVQLTTFSGRRYSIRLSSAILSFEDVPLEPFSFNFSKSATQTPVFSPPGITYTEPPTFNNEQLEPGAAVVLYFSPGTGRAKVEQGLSIRVGRLGGTSAPADFDLEWAPDESAVALRPRTPLQGGDQLTVLLSMLPWGINQVIPYFFNAAPAIPVSSGTALFLRRVSVDFEGVPTNAVLDFEFSNDVPDSVLATASAFFWDGPFEQPRPIGELRITRLSPRILRLVPSPLPASLLAPGAYANYILRFGSEIVARNFIRFTNLPLRPSQKPAFTLPINGAEDVLLNIDPQLVFPVSVSRLTGTITLESGGIRLPLTVQWNNTAKIATLRRQGLLKPNARYSLLVENMQDITGRPLPNQRIEFRTGGRTERVVTPQLLFWEPVGTQVSRNPDIRLYYDRPFIYGGQGNGVYDWISSTYNSPFGGWIEYLDGGRVLRLLPDGPLPDASIIYLPFSDANRNPISFRTTSDLADPPPGLTLVTPYRDSTGVPANALIQFRFSAPVLRSTLSGVSILANGEPLFASTELGNDGITVTLRPRTVLPSSSLIEVRLDGVANTANIPSPTVLSWSFRTAPLLPQPPDFTARWNAQAGTVEFSVPVNPLTVNPNSCLLYERNAFLIAARAELSPDGLQLRCVPAVTLRPEFWYRLNLPEDISSWSGQLLSRTGFELPPEYSPLPADRQPPRLLNTIPRQGTPLSPPDPLLLTFDEPVNLRAAQVEISLNGQLLSASVTSAPTSSAFTTLAYTYSLAPISGWLPNRVYSVRISKASDAAGNQAPPIDLQILTGPLNINLLEGLRLLSSSPANNSVGVAPDTTVSFNFSRPVAPAWDLQPLAQFSPARAVLSNDFLEIGLPDNSLTLRPISGWPPATFVSLRPIVRDQSGSLTTATVNFTTAAPTDQTPPQLQQITPAATERLPSGTTRFVARFDEPVTFTQTPVEISSPAASVVFQGTVLTPASGDGRVLTWEASLPAGSAITLRLRAITDLSGNLMPERTFTYFTVSADEDITSPRLVSSSPERPQFLSGSNPITLRFSQPMDQNSLANAISIARSNQLVAFSLATTDSGHTWTLTPSSPWPLGDLQLSIAATAYSQAGLLFSGPQGASFFVTAPNPQSAAPPSLAAYLASDQVIDLLFDQPLAETPAEPFGLRLDHQRLPGVIRRMSDRWLQILPDEPLRQDASYHLMLGPSLEIPLRWSPEQLLSQSPTSQQPAASLTPGSQSWRLERPTHRFALASLSCPNGLELLVQPQTRDTTSLTVLDKVVGSQLECILPTATPQVGGQKLRLKRD